MVYEIATIQIAAANAALFEAAVAKAAPLFKSAAGCSAMMLERSIEHEGRYRLVVQWASVEHHMVQFRESSAFGEWRALVGPFFTAPPVVEHSITVARYF